MNKLLKSALVTTGALLIMGSVPSAHAAKGDYGVDNAVYQGAYGKFGYVKVQTPRGSIVALDIESGGQNTDVIMGNNVNTLEWDIRLWSMVTRTT